MASLLDYLNKSRTMGYNPPTPKIGSLIQKLPADPNAGLKIEKLPADPNAVLQMVNLQQQAPVYQLPLTDVEQDKQDIARQRADIEAKIAEAKGQVLGIQGQLANAQAAGITSGEIPENVLNAPDPRSAQIAGLENYAFAAPTKTSTDLYNELYGTSGLQGIQAKVDEINQSIIAKKKALSKEEAEVMGNPWASEASRIGEAKRLYEMAQEDIQTDLDTQKLYQEQLDRGKELILGQAKSQIERETMAQSLAQKQLEYLSNKDDEDVLSVAEAKALNVPFGTTAKEAKGLMVSTEDELLSVSEAKELGLPFGTTTKEARAMGITPQKIKESGEEQLYSGLSSQTAAAVRAKVAKFSAEPTIQNFATVQEGYNFASSLSDKTTNPADDQALIYQLAKSLDPGSVVREGEYATAQKYAQSWVKAYGKGVTQALAGTGFLSEEARKNIKTTIKQKYMASKKSYDNLLGRYESGINSLTGRGDGSDFLVDYAIPDIEEQKITNPVKGQTKSGLNYTVEE